MEFCRFLCCVIFIQASLPTAHVSSATCPETASTIGTNFVFGVPAKRLKTNSKGGDNPTKRAKGKGDKSSSDIYVHITTTSDLPARVRVTAPFINYDQQFTVHNSTIVSLNQSLVQTDEGVQFKGIEVFSDSNISVAVIPYLTSLDTEGFLVLPTPALSQRYIAAAYTPVDPYNTSVLVVGTENNTNVLIKYQKNVQASFEYRNVTLQKLETFQAFSGDGNDISGAVVTSDKPVAVLSGSVASKVPAGLGWGCYLFRVDYNFLVEQMIPTKYWVNQFIVPPIYPHNNFIVRIFVDQNNTEVHLYNSTIHIAVYLDQGSMHEMMFGADPAVILANKPVSVIQYCADLENMNGNPFMTTVQGISQYTNSYKFTTESFSKDLDNPDSTLALTITKNIFNGLQLNGKNISSWNPKTVPVPKPMDDYMTVFINVSHKSVYKMNHVNGNKFGATLFDLINPATAFGYPLQLSFSTSGNASWCMECDGMSDLQSCNKVVKCTSENEVCYVQAYARNQTLQVFRSGCLARNKCQIQEGSVNCTHCCEGDFCNTNGCGDSGLPELRQRGPVCFNCLNQTDGEYCQAVQMCKTGQVCKIEQFQLGSGFQNTMGCAEATTCVSKRSVSHVHARDATICSHCCGNDFCNMNCTSQQSPSIIG